MHLQTRGKGPLLPCPDQPLLWVLHCTSNIQIESEMTENDNISFQKVTVTRNYEVPHIE